MRASFFLFLSFVPAMVSVAACDVFEVHACTEIGCTNGLQIEFDSAPGAGTVIQVESSGGPAWSVECGVDQESCEYGVFFPDYTPGFVTIRLKTSQGEMSYDLRPEYSKHQPNGPDCHPTCLVAEVRIELP